MEGRETKKKKKKKGMWKTTSKFTNKSYFVTNYPKHVWIKQFKGRD